MSYVSLTWAFWLDITCCAHEYAPFLAVAGAFVAVVGILYHVYAVEAWFQEIGVDSVARFTSGNTWIGHLDVMHAHRLRVVLCSRAAWIGRRVGHSRQRA